MDTDGCLTVALISLAVNGVAMLFESWLVVWALGSMGVVQAPFWAVFALLFVAHIAGQGGVLTFHDRSA